MREGEKGIAHISKISTRVPLAPPLHDETFPLDKTCAPDLRAIPTVDSIPEKRGRAGDITYRILRLASEVVKHLGKVL